MKIYYTDSNSFNGVRPPKMAKQCRRLTGFSLSMNGYSIQKPSIHLMDPWNCGLTVNGVVRIGNCFGLHIELNV